MDRVLHRLRSETGTSLIEVLAAAVILVVIAGAVTSLMNSAQRQSGQTRIVAIAGDLAQSELEQLRAKKFSDLTALSSAPVPVDAGGVKFTVSRSSGWASASGDSSVGCSSTENKPEALRVSVSVDWASNPRRPVRLDTLVAAPVSEEATGNYVIQINDRDGNGLPGIPVTLTGPEAASGTTDSSGCVRFSGLEQGMYTVAFNKTGYVDNQHNPAVSDSITVEGGETGSKAFDYDQQGGTDVRFKRRIDGNAANFGPVAVNPVRFKSAAATVAATPFLVSGYTVAQEPKPMFPLAGQYSVYTDVCELGQAVGGASVPRNTMNPPRADIIVPLLWVRIQGLDSGMHSLVKLRVKTQCGTTLADVTGTTENSSTWSARIPVPPGTLQNVCVFGGPMGSTWYWRNTANVLVKPSPDHDWPASPQVNIALSGSFSGLETGSAGQVCT